MDATVIVSLCSLALAVIVYLSNRQKDTRTDAAREARHETKLDGIARGIEDIRVEVRTVQKKMEEHGMWIARVEAFASETRHRVEKLEKNFNRVHPPVDMKGE